MAWRALVIARRGPPVDSTQGSNFVKVMPRDYRKMLDAFKRVEDRGLMGDDAALTAFREAMAEAS